MRGARVRIVTAAVALAALAAGAGTVGSSAAGAVGSPPDLEVPALAGFVTGTAIGPMAPSEDGPLATYDIAMRARWHATSPAGVCGSSTRAEYAGSEPDPWTAWSGATSLTVRATDYDSQEGGGGGKVVGYDVRVRDCAGRVAQSPVRFLPGVFQEDGSAYGYSGVTSRFTGPWWTARGARWSGGTARATRSCGARAVFRFDTPGPVGLVSDTGPYRGRFRVRVDGVPVATVDTGSSTRRSRVVVWTGTLRGSGEHTVTVVPLGTAGRPRVDVDAVLVSGAHL